MKLSFFFLLVFAFFTQIAFAGCYTPEQYRAEQAIRFHTKLMVMGLYCKTALKQNTYATYQDFTRRNQNVIRAQENKLIDQFRQNHAASPEKELHSLRTNLANNLSLQAGMSTGRFCQSNLPLLQQAKSMIPKDFERWIAQSEQLAPSTQQRCQ